MPTGICPEFCCEQAYLQMVMWLCFCPAAAFDWCLRRGILGEFRSVSTVFCSTCLHHARHLVRCQHACEERWLHHSMLWLWCPVLRHTDSHRSRKMYLKRVWSLQFLACPSAGSCSLCVFLGPCEIVWSFYLKQTQKNL